jgi:hypothetical protein
MNFQTMSKQRKFILIAAVAGIIAMFLPWITISIFGFGSSINGMHGSGILVFLSFVGAGIVSYMGDQTKTLEKTFWFVALICGALATLIMLWFLIDTMGSVGMSFLSFGFYLAVLAAIGVLGSAYLFRSPTDSIKSGFDSLKNDIEQKSKNPNPPPPSQP